MSDNPLDSQFQKKSEFLIGIDSDGCAFDSMEIKHKECFIPNFINYFGLQPISKYAREAAEFTNLYSKWRGANRFISYTLALDLLEERPEVQARNVQIPKLQGVRDWIERETKLGNPTLSAEVEKTHDPDLEIALKWSLAVNEMIADMVHDVPPYPNVRESLLKLDPVADMIVCSATPNEALNKEWEEHDIAQYVDAICGQEAGSKKETLGQAKDCGYEPNKVLMIGDAPGDMKAAEAVGALFYPINPGCEEASWERFIGEACDKFLNGEYAGEYQEKVIAEFDSYLPELPPWKQ
ncbi:MAG: HAD hydrolase-like protein [Planctomycetes bacterium]|nr:HAD hydrolase-like protein [Planctomycetota bacterium]MCH9726466.1 HAD hydrolase-like protein [Planctomycetota bacterium]MCH9778275.1 HAD hydrolase-like protein [Planctomycetota bacterium]MCH9792460.1 HAD hydrolase-like protein [Planctomycetota bacterium]MDF1744361.1 HAD hydrolase-like protein [Gimesia sp.]